jgi:hypothetical protein
VSVTRYAILIPVVLLTWGCSDDPGVIAPPPLEPPPNAPPTLVAEWGEPGTGEGQFQTISALEIDEADVVYLADWNTPRVQLFRTDGTFLSQWPIQIPGLTVDSGPMDLALGLNGDVYELHNNGGPGWVARFTRTGDFVSLVTLVAGEGDGEFFFPTAVAVDVSGNLYVSDWTGSIQKLDPEGLFLEVWTGGDPPLDQPIDLEWGPNGTLFTLARQSHVHEFGLDGSPLQSWLVDHHTPEVIAVDSFGLVYTSSQRRQTIERSTVEGIQIEWDDAATGGIVIASDGSVLVGHPGSVAVYRY